MSVVKLDRARRSRPLDEYPDVLTLSEVAEILRHSEDRTRSWLRTGAIHSVKVGSKWKVAKSVLIAHLSGEEANG